MEGEKHDMHGMRDQHHTDHDKYSMVLGCFIAVLVLLVIMIMLLGASTHKQGQMLNNSNAAMDQISNLKKAVVGMKGANALGISGMLPGGRRKGGFSNGMNPNGPYMAGGSYNNVNTPFWGPQNGRSQLTNQYGENIGTGQGLQAGIGANCPSGTCGGNTYDTLGVYSSGGSGGGEMLSSNNSEVASELALFQDVLGTISQDVTIAKNDISMLQGQRANLQGQRANLQGQMAAR